MPSLQPLLAKPPGVDAPAAARELLARRGARSSLLGFASFTNDLYRPAAHHKVIAEALERVERGECKRLAIFMPPRHGKSELASRRFPAWYLGRNPKRQIITASYNGDIAADFGRDVRNIIASQDYRAVFPGVSLAPDSQAANKWHTDAGGAYVAAGVGTAITGRGADLLLIDDPVKDREEADSEVRRARVWDWYTSTAFTRLMPGAAVVLIQTRWHDDDLAGRLLEQMAKGTGEQWEILSLKAMTDDGRALWPEWYDAPRLQQIRSVIGPRDWSALYQQEPVPETGEFFRREWVRWYEKPPAQLTIYGASDYAVTDGGGDWTGHKVAGVDPAGDLYVLDCWRQQAGPKEWIDALCDLIAAWRPLEWGEESGQIRGSLGSFVETRMLERKVYAYRNAYPSVTDKANRAQAIRGRMSMGKVYFPLAAPWVETLVYELLRFPSGTHDDQVDALAMFGRMLERLSKPVEPTRPAPGKTLQTATFSELMAAHDRDNRRRARI